MNDKIDFVIPWVDGSDPEWLSVKNKYSSHNDINYDSEIRYRDWGYLKYWFRGVEKFTPWVNKIHFITFGHVPNWLNASHDKINIVCHEDYIPAQYLPTFSSHVIEINIHRIKGLSELFVYFNDDCFIIKEMSKEIFFKSSLPCDEGIFSYIFHTNYNSNYSHYLLNIVGIINQNFNFQEQLLKNEEKFLNRVYADQLDNNKFYSKFNLFPGFYTIHLPQAFKKSTFAEVWSREKELLNQVSFNKFRDIKDISQYLMRYWQLMKGEFEPTYFRKNGWNFFNPSLEFEKIVNFIESQERPMICINDSGKITDFTSMRNAIANAFEKILPEKSTFEL